MENQLNTQPDNSLPANNKADRYLLIFLGFIAFFCLVTMIYFITQDPSSILKNDTWLAFVIAFSVLIPIFLRFFSGNKQSKPLDFLKVKSGPFSFSQKIGASIYLIIMIPLLLFVLGCLVWEVLTNFR